MRGDGILTVALARLRAGVASIHASRDLRAHGTTTGCTQKWGLDNCKGTYGDMKNLVGIALEGLWKARRMFLQAEFGCVLV